MLFPIVLPTDLQAIYHPRQDMSNEWCPNRTIRFPSEHLGKSRVWAVRPSVKHTDGLVPLHNLGALHLVQIQLRGYNGG